ncbi:MAG: helix-turn-helix transcriptional regulator, partial [Ilumatobacteraceae bacterium]
ARHGGAMARRTRGAGVMAKKRPTPKRRSPARRATPKRRGPRSASERVAGLLVLLPWLMKRKRVRLADVAKQFRMSEEDLVADIHMAAVCGVPPYTPVTLIDVFIDDGWVVAEVPNFFTRPLRLTSAEMYAVIAMVRAAQKLPGAPERSVLARAVSKLAKLAPEATDGPVHIDLPDEPNLEDLRSAQADSAELRIEYFNPARSEVAQRTIRVVRIFSESGHWYVLADDDKSGAIRNFRVDRIQSVVRTGKLYNQADVASRIEDDADGGWFGSDLELVTLRVRGDATWIAEAYPTVSRRKNRDGSIDVALRVSSEHWLSRLLLRGGRNVQVLEPAKYSDLAARTAALVRARYA